MATRSQYEYEIATILKEEDRRIEEAEALEIELTHLAFTNVSVEDTEKDLETKRAEWVKELSQIRDESRKLMVRVRSLHQKVGRNVGMQSVRLGLDVVTEEEVEEDIEEDAGDSASGGKTGSRLAAVSFDSDTDSTDATTVASVAANPTRQIHTDG